MGQEVGSPRFKAIQWGSVSLLTAVGIVFILDRSTLAIANHDVSSELHLSPVQMGLLLSGFSWAYAFSQLPLGLMLDRLGARRVLGSGILLWAIAQMFTGLVGSLNQFLAARILLGIAEAPTFPAGAKVIASWFRRSARGGPTGIFLASTTIGPVIGPPIITTLLVGLGWRQMYWALGLSGLALSFLWFAGTRGHNSAALTADDRAHLEEPEENDGQLANFSTMLSLLRQRSTVGLILGFVGIIYMIWLYLTWLPVYLEHERHFSITRVGWILSIPYLFGTLGNLVSGYLSDYLLRRGLSAVNSRKYPICAGLLGSAAFTVPVAFTPDATMAVAYLCAVMFFLYLASAGAWNLVNLVTPHKCIATVGAMQNFGGYFGGSFAPIVTGWLLARTNSFQSALVTSALIACVAATFYLVLVRKPIEVAAPAAAAGKPS